MEINLRKGYKTIGVSFHESEYHDKWYILINLYKKTIEIELWNCNVKGNEIDYGFCYDFADRALHLKFHRWRKCFLFGN